MVIAQTFSYNKEQVVLQKELPFVAIMSHAMFSKAALNLGLPSTEQGREGAVVSGCIWHFQGPLSHVRGRNEDVVVL